MWHCLPLYTSFAANKSMVGKKAAFGGRALIELFLLLLEEGGVRQRWEQSNVNVCSAAFSQAPEC
jgi:hypothetical protein